MPSGRGQFDVHEALDRALEVFGPGVRGGHAPGADQGHGHQPAEPLCRLGNKEQLFRRALDHYQTGPQSFLTEALKKPTARGTVEAIFCGFVGMQGKSKGCMIVSGALACGAEGEPVRQELIRLRQAAVMILRERFERGIREGDLPKRTDSATLARYVVTVLNGMAVQAVSGATGDELRKVARLALESWPG